jgi:uncharacterized BrkB/YihY/UPF0761 family membrane protein
MSERSDDRDSWRSRGRARVLGWRDASFARAQEALLVVPALDLLWELRRRYRRLNGPVLTGHLTYRLFLWLAPFCLLLIATLGYGATDSFNLGEVIEQAGVDDEFSSTVTQQAQGGRLYALWIGLFGLVVASYSLIMALHYIFAQVWEIEIVPRRGIVAAVAKFLGSTAVALVGILLISAARDQGVVLRAGAAAGSLVFYGLLALLVSWLLPRRNTSVLGLVPGALFVSVGLLLLHLVAQYYLPNRIHDSAQVYGTLGIVIAIFFYLWCIATLLVGSAFVNAVWNDRDLILDGRPFVADPDRLPPRVRGLLFRAGSLSDRATRAASTVEERLLARRAHEETDPGEGGPADEDRP